MNHKAATKRWQQAKVGGMLKLCSPYGYMTVDGRRVMNGHEVRAGRLVGVDGTYKIPSHWISHTAAISERANQN